MNKTIRESGILLPISSLSNDYGIGTFGKEAYKFVDFLKKANQKYWQILPLGPTSYGDSPYQSFCVFAGNPYFIDFDLLNKEGLLKKSDYVHLKTDEVMINYEKLYNTRFDVLKKAFKNFDVNTKGYFQFLKYNEEWINNYAVFMTLKKLHGDNAWHSWGKNNYFSFELINEITYKYEEDVSFWKFVQYIFYKQWYNLKEYANSKGIEIIGDVPIYVAYDSSDVWSLPQYFQLDSDFLPTRVAGCPPDSFSETGQLWGNPLYNYDVMKENGFDWWVKRLKKASELYDVIRIDHFRGFEAYYSISASASTAVDGYWVKGPGMDLFEVVKEKIGNIKIIAEDLGYITEEVKKLITDTNFPGMKVLQFAFDTFGESDYLPHNFENSNCVVYTGTHDNLPTAGWLKTLPKKVLKYFDEYLEVTSPESRVDKMINLALMSSAKMSIIIFQDYLKLDEKSRINTPSTNINNWTWRLEKTIDYDKLAKKIANLMKIYYRNYK